VFGLGTKALEARVHALEVRLALPQDSGREAAKREFRGVLFAEWGADLRAKSDQEHLLAGAAMGGFGAVAWGVAALQPGKYLDTEVYLRPAVVAAIGTFILAVAIVVKIFRDHRMYARGKAIQNDIVAAVNSDFGEIIPEVMLARSGNGYLYSIAVVIIAAIAAVAFCLSVAGPLW
jgi:hypothetical protein